MWQYWGKTLLTFSVFLYCVQIMARSILLSRKQRWRLFSWRAGGCESNVVSEEEQDIGVCDGVQGKNVLEYCGFLLLCSLEADFDLDSKE